MKIDDALARLSAYSHAVVAWFDDEGYPMQTAAGWTAPTPVVETDKGPPGGMASSWLAHLDLPSLLLTSLRPAG